MGDTVGMMNIAMPSIVIKMMRQKFDQQWSLRKSESTDVEQGRMLNLIRGSSLDSEVLLSGPEMLLRDLINLEAGDVLSFDRAASQPLDMRLNGDRRYLGDLVRVGQRAGFRIQDLVREEAR